MFEVATIGIQTLSKPPNCCKSVYIFWGHSVYITRLASNKILSPSNKIHREVGRAKDLSAPLYTHVSMRNLLNSVNFSPLFRRISRHMKIKHAGPTLAAEESLSLYLSDISGSLETNLLLNRPSANERTNTTVTLSTRENRNTNARCRFS